MDKSTDRGRRSLTKKGVGYPLREKTTPDAKVRRGIGTRERRGAPTIQNARRQRVRSTLGGLQERWTSS